MNEPGAYTNWAVAEQSNYGNDIEQFGQLLATLLGHCHGSSEYIKVMYHMHLERFLSPHYARAHFIGVLDDGCDDYFHSFLTFHICIFFLKFKLVLLHC